MSEGRPAAEGIFAALLRGVNVGGKNTIPMGELCELFTGLGHADVVSYIQSGNVVFRSAEPEAARVASALEAAIESRFGLPVSVLLRTPSELQEVVSGNPFLPRTETSKLHAVFLSGRPEKAAAEALDPDRSPGDEFSLAGSTIYLRYPNGSGRSKLTLDYFERRLGLAGTARNWNTVMKLVELTHG